MNLISSIFRFIFFDVTNELSYAAPLYDGELNELTEQIINSVTGDEKRIIEFFRDSILNLNFLYRKLETINELFDKIREEHESYRRGGWSFNDHLFNAEFAIKNLYNFLKLNCLCLEHYHIYKSIINRYLEILLLSYDNSYVNTEKSILIERPRGLDILIWMMFN